ncbi:MAG: tripartite tricarboxylate transporter TctB family protein [Desulfitobacterium sp.]
MRKGTIIILSIFVLLSVYLYWLTFGFSDVQSDPVGPAGYPRVCLILILGLSLLGLWQNRKPEAKLNAVKLNNWKLIIISLILLLSYTILMTNIGYFIVTPIFLILVMRVLKVENWVAVISVAAVFTLFIYFAFYKVLQLPLPMGILG